MNNVKIIVATTKPYWMPQDKMYLPLQVGATGKPPIGYLRDDTGDNISFKNANYCELTGLYWAWKNLDCDAIGLVHYRRYLGKFGFTSKQKRIATSSQVEHWLTQADVIVPKPRHYYIENNWSQYVHAHHEGDIELLRHCIQKHSPDYLLAFDKVMKRTWGHRFNIFIMKKTMLSQYCNWLFNLLENMEKQLTTKNYSTYQARVYGFLGERLLDVWLEKNNVRYFERSVLYMQHQNWITKVFRFIKRKYYPQKKGGLSGECSID